ncbi:LysR substrate-binding domain-containing protein [Xenophilus sp.]|uniref:LysR substrate-binding domain-containing protein n=1 Tax=Xenophilus sp. TaxID=1873499 RepID=UPI0037DD6E40
MLSVRAFEAAARHANFARAGEELCVSAGAIGHQVRLLEEWVGRGLFVRGARSVELTELGRRYFLEVRSLLEELERASLSLRNAADDAEVTVTAMPSFVTRWLMPRLGRFRTLHPRIEVRLLASVPPVDFAKDRVDLAIRLGAGAYAGFVSEALLPETFHAVVHPSLQDGLRKPRDVLQCTLLHDEYETRIPEQMDWPRWCAAQGLGVAAQRLRQGLRFSHTYLTLDAAAAGQGVAVASDVLAGDAVAQGLLVRAPGVPVEGPYKYHLVHPRTSADRPQVSAFCDWLRQEAANFRRTAGAPPA